MSEPLRTTLIRRTPVAEGVVDFDFSVVSPAAFTFRPGQFVTLAVGKDPHGQDVRRSYSIASLASEPGHLRLILRLLPGGPGSAFFDALAPGDAVAMTGPHGFFVLDDRHEGAVVIAATGTGIAPVLPMLAELARRDDGLPRRVFWGARHEADLFLTDEVKAAAGAARAELFIHLSQPGPSWSGESGRVTQAVLATVDRLPAPTFYLVGNGAMITELKRELQARGVNRKKQIRTEAFFD